jgi:serine phosphatase RsbU (regulator of sigma subunit)
MNGRAWLINSWTGRSFLAAIVLKGLLVAALWLTGGTSALENADRIVNLGLIVLASAALVDLTLAVRARLLWRVRRKLILSYILIGAVPILLLIAFSLLAFLLVFFDISSYLVRNRLNTLTEQANNLARTTLTEVDRTQFEARPDVLSRRQGVLETRYPGISLAIVPTSGNPRCGLAASKDLPAPSIAGSLPRWVSCRGFSGLLLYQAPPSTPGRLRLVARAAALPNRANPDYAVVVDLPVDEASTAQALEGTGIRLGTLAVVAKNSGADPLPVEPEDADDGIKGAARGFFNTATFITYTDWQNGLPGRAALSMNVQVGSLYNWLGGDQTRTTDANFNRILLAMLVGIGALLLVIEMVALGNGLALARSITDSVDELFKGTERVKAGEYSERIPQRSDDQLGDLALSFNLMTASIKQAIEDREEKQRLEGELRIAREIQMSLLPQGPLEVPGIQLAALCAPAREVGGDYYDYLPLGPDRFALLIADVSGKGASAALYMAELKGLMLSLSRHHTSPRELLIEADRIISLHLDNRSFITMIYAVVDTRARTLTCARAGHTPFIRIPGGARERCARVLAPDGMVLGLNLDSGERFARTLREVTLPLDEGDLFFFFTDGISEAMDGGDGYFGEARLTSFLEAHADESPDDIRDGLLREVADFTVGQPQHDDITMIILKVNAGG